MCRKPYDIAWTTYYTSMWSPLYTSMWLTLLSCTVSSIFIWWRASYNLTLGSIFLFQWSCTIPSSWWIILLCKPVVYGAWLVSMSPWAYTRMMIASCLLLDARIQARMEEDEDVDFLVHRGSVVQRIGSFVRPRCFVYEHACILCIATLIGSGVWGIPVCLYIWYTRKYRSPMDIKDFSARRVRWLRRVLCCT